jgi:hypothetical protein
VFYYFLVLEKPGNFLKVKHSLIKWYDPRYLPCIDTHKQPHADVHFNTHCSFTQNTPTPKQSVSI